MKNRIRQMSARKKIVYGVIMLTILTVAGYAVRCHETEICRPHFFEKFVRKSALIMTPSGVITAEVVDKQAPREQGLSGRTGLGKHTGMLFSFGFPGRYGFWMKDMQFPIDIIWINSKGVVVHIVENAKPEDYPATYINEAPASFVLELASGGAREQGLYLGSKIELLIEK